MTRFQTQLRAAGMSAPESAAKAALFETLDRELRLLQQGTSGRHSAFFIPGRLEFLGKHTDYAGGRSLICAIERGICLVTAPRADAQVRIFDTGRASSVNFALDARVEPAVGHWSNFPITVADRLVRDFPSTHTGADIVFASDLPRASGMSSSSALMVAVFFALAQVNSLSQTEAYRRAFPTREELAGYLAAVESGGSFGSFSGTRGVGTHGGSEDHVAILCSRAGFLRQYSFCTIRFEKEIRFPEDHTLVIAVSGVKADKTGDAREAYNRASGAARRILELWRNATGRDDSSLIAVLSSGLDALERLRQILLASNNTEYSAEVLLNRLTQFCAESNEIIPAAAEALERGDFARLGPLVDRSQSLAETYLGNQIPETTALLRSARQLGAIAASSFGAGFGGSVWALTGANGAEEFREAWSAQYHQRFPERADASRFFVARPGPGLIQLA
jgi:galactokinase